MQHSYARRAMSLLAYFGTKLRRSPISPASSADITTTRPVVEAEAREISQFISHCHGLTTCEETLLRARFSVAAMYATGLRFIKQFHDAADLRRLHIGLSWE